MHAAHTNTGSQRFSQVSGDSDLAREPEVFSNELVDGPRDNREHLFPVLRVDEVLELGALAHVTPIRVRSRGLLVREVTSRHEVEEGQRPAAFLLAPVAFEFLIDG